MNAWIKKKLPNIFPQKAGLKQMPGVKVRSRDTTFIKELKVSSFQYNTAKLKLLQLYTKSPFFTTSYPYMYCVSKSWS